MKKTLFAIGVLLSLHLSTNQVQAFQDPALFSCLTSQGTIIAQYTTGTHGIPGNTQSYTGSDVVYQIDNQYVLQCFCPMNNDTGIQSNWWQVEHLSSNEIELFTRRGWVFVPNGQLWGLSKAPYLVKNNRFSCQGQGGNTHQTGSSSSNSETTSNSSGSSGAAQNSPIEKKVGYVLGTKVLGATGTQQLFLTYAALGLLFAGLAIYLARQ